MEKPWQREPEGKLYDAVVKMSVAVYILALLLLLFVLIAALTQFLWNFTMPFIFGLPEISIWHAAALMILARLLFSEVKFHKTG